MDKCYRDISWTYDDYKGEATALAEALQAAWPDNHQLSIMVWAFCAVPLYLPFAHYVGVSLFTLSTMLGSLYLPFTLCWGLVCVESFAHMYLSKIVGRAPLDLNDAHYGVVGVVLGAARLVLTQ